MAVFSHSRLASYETCPLQYRLRYVDKIDIERRETVEAFVGRRVHETLQYLHDRLMEGVLHSQEEVLAHLQNSWEREWHGGVLIVRAEMTQRDYWNFAVRCVKNYYQKNKPFDRDETMSTEMAVMFELDEERDIQIKGYIDRLARVGPSSYEIHDYKTSKRLPTQNAIDKDRQLALYQMAIHRMVEDADNIRLVWHFLAHNKKLTSARTRDQLIQLKKTVLTLIDRIDKATDDRDFPANRSRLCDWCDYRPVCPAWNPVQENLGLGLEPSRSQE